jgi:hypothetical protein
VSGFDSQGSMGFEFASMGSGPSPPSIFLNLPPDSGASPRSLDHMISISLTEGMPPILQSRSFKN